MSKLRYNHLTVVLIRPVRIIYLIDHADGVRASGAESDLAQLEYGQSIRLRIAMA